MSDRAQRYHPKMITGIMEEVPDGNFVLYQDHDRVVTENERLRELLRTFFEEVALGVTVDTPEGFTCEMTTERWNEFDGSIKAILADKDKEEP